MNQSHHQLDYIEIPSTDLNATRQFLGQVFDWQYTDYGPDYCSVDNAGIDGGIFSAEKAMTTANGSALLVFYSDDLRATQEAVTRAGGEIIMPIFDFPGGQRFHFVDPAGNEYAAWKTHVTGSDQ